MTKELSKLSSYWSRLQTFEMILYIVTNQTVNNIIRSTAYCRSLGYILFSLIRLSVYHIIVIFYLASKSSIVIRVVEQHLHID